MKVGMGSYRWTTVIDWDKTSGHSRDSQQQASLLEAVGSCTASNVCHKELITNDGVFANELGPIFGNMLIGHLRMIPESQYFTPKWIFFFFLEGHKNRRDETFDWVDQVTHIHFPDISHPRK